jgi:G3E family GTPase
MSSLPIPLVVITGFLGSGKTTLLKAWAPRNPVPREKTVLVINDFGPVNIDAGLLEELKFSLRSIAGGCVCCQTFAELIEELRQLAAEGRWEWAWLETSGLAEPEEVLDHLTDPAIRDKIAIHRFVHVVDATHFPARWRHQAVEEEQLRFADTLVLTKIDQVSAERVAAIRSRLATLNPAAAIIESERGAADPSFLWQSRSTAAASAGEDGPSACGHHVRTSRGPGAVTLFLPFPQPVARTAFDDFLRALPAAVYRAKGLIRFAEEPSALWTFQRVGSQEETLILPLATGSTLADPGVVVIGPDLDEDALRRAHERLFS